MNFGPQIEDLIGPVGDDGLITESLSMIGSEIINAAPIEKLNNVSITAAIPADTGSEGSEVASVGVAVHDKRVLGASKDGYSARLINPEEKARYLSDSSIYRATDVSPVYYLQGDTAFVIATQNVETSGTLRFVPKVPVSTDALVRVDAGDSTTYAFPKEAETLMIVGTAARCLLRLMTNISTPEDVTEPVILEPSEILPTFTPPASFNAPAIPADADIDFTNVPTAPSFSKPILDMPSVPVIADLDVSITAPTAPSLSSNSVTFNADAPTYTKPLVSLTTVPAINWDLPVSPIDPIFDWSDITQNVSEMVMPAGIVLPSLDVGVFPASDIDWSTPNVPVSPVIDWSVVYQTVQDIILPSKIILPALSFGDTPTVTWNFPNAPVQPELSYANITQDVDDINLPAEIVLPSLSIPDAPEVTWNFPGEPVQAPLDWGDLESWITGEDAEMANTRINAVRAQVDSYQGSYSAYGTAVNAIVARNQGKIGTWGDEWKTKAQVYSQELAAMVDKYRGESQGKQAIVQAQVASRNSQVEEVLKKAQATVNLYQAKVSVYQAEVNSIIQQNIATLKGWSDECNTKSQKFAAEIGAKVQKYTAEAGGEAKVSQAQIAVRAQQLQEVQSKAQTEVQVYNAKMQAYQMQVATMAQKNKAIAQNWQIEWGTKVQNFSTETNAIVTKYQGEIGGKSKAVQAQVAVLQGQIQEASAKNSASLEVYKAQVQGYQTDVNVIIQRNGAQIAAWKQENGLTLQKHGMDMQNSLNDFNKESAEYMAQLRISTTNAELSSKDDGQLLQKYGAELQSYQAQVNKDMQEYAVNEIQKEVGIWTKDVQGKLGRYSTDIQNETGKVGNDMAIYVQEIRKSLQKFQAESGYDLGKYSAQLQTESSRFMSDLKKNTDTFRTSLERYRSELQKVSAENQTKLAKYGASIQDHNAKMQKNMADYQWKHGQYQTLRGEYVQGLQLFMKTREDVMNLEQKRRR